MAGQIPYGSKVLRAGEVAEVWGQANVEALALWAIDALTDPPVRIDAPTTRVPTSRVREGRTILEGAGLDWRKLKGATTSRHYAQRQDGER